MPSWLKFIINLIGKMHWPFTHRELTHKSFDYFQNMPTGSVFLATTKGEISNVINFGSYKHGAIWLGDKFFEFTGKGGHYTSYYDFMKNKNKIIVTDLIGITHPQRQMIKQICQKLVGEKYDYDFKLENESYYCFEAVAYVLNKATETLAVLPDRFLWRKVYSYKSFTGNQFKYLANSKLTESMNA